jgi:hypothetical protein
MKPEYLSCDDVEARAEQVLVAYERQSRRPLSYPVPIDRVIDQILDIPILWEPIPQKNGREIVSKITQPTLEAPPRIVLNQDLLSTKFAECPGLENTALAHEAGHASFHLDHGRKQQLGLFAAEDDDAFVSASSALTDGLAEALEAHALAARGPIGDDWWREWQAHTFMRFVLMPRRLLLPLIAEGGYRDWRGPNGLYDLRDRFNVTISALVVHLNKLGCIRIDNQGRIHDLSPLTTGQHALRV